MQCIIDFDKDRRYPTGHTWRTPDTGYLLRLVTVFQYYIACIFFF